MNRLIAIAILSLGVALLIIVAARAIVEYTDIRVAPASNLTLPTVAKATATPAPTVKATAGGMTLPVGPKAVVASRNAQSFSKEEMLFLIETNWGGLPVNYDCRQSYEDGVYTPGVYVMCIIIIYDPDYPTPREYKLALDQWRLVPQAIH